MFWIECVTNDTQPFLKRVQRDSSAGDQEKTGIYIKTIKRDIQRIKFSKFQSEFGALIVFFFWKVFYFGATLKNISVYVHRL